MAVPKTGVAAGTSGKSTTSPAMLNWDERYRAAEGYVFATAPNDFLAAKAHLIPPGPVLCLAEGERDVVEGTGHTGPRIPSFRWSRFASVPHRRFLLNQLKQLVGWRADALRWTSPERPTCNDSPPPGFNWM